MENISMKAFFLQQWFTRFNITVFYHVYVCAWFSYSSDCNRRLLYIYCAAYSCQNESRFVSVLIIHLLLCMFNLSLFHWLNEACLAENRIGGHIYFKALNVIKLNETRLFCVIFLYDFFEFLRCISFADGEFSSIK